MKHLLFLILLTSSLISFSQSEKSNIYSGGMLILQPGFCITKNNHKDINELSFGLGGILRFYLFKHFTAGVNGGSQKATYSSGNSDNSTISLGYGGAFVGLTRKIN